MTQSIRPFPRHGSRLARPRPRGIPRESAMGSGMLATALALALGLTGCEATGQPPEKATGRPPEEATAQPPEGLQPEEGEGGDRELRRLPVFRALDTDDDGDISAGEIDAAPESLASLDDDGDGRLSSDELRPRRAAPRVFFGSPGNLPEGTRVMTLGRRRRGGYRGSAAAAPQSPVSRRRRRGRHRFRDGAPRRDDGDAGRRAGRSGARERRRTDSAGVGNRDRRRGSAGSKRPSWRPLTWTRTAWSRRRRWNRRPSRCACSTPTATGASRQTSFSPLRTTIPAATICLSDAAAGAALPRPRRAAAVGRRTGSRETPACIHMDTLLRDLVSAARRLAAQRGFTLAALLTLALGIGANAAMFSVVHGLLLRPLPYPNPERIVRVAESGRGGGGMLTNRAMFLLENAEAFEHLAAYRETSPEWTGPDGTVTLRGATVSPALFPLLRATPHLGRLFTEDEAREGADRVALLSHRAWTNHFASDPGIVGSPVALDGDPYTVVGVLPEGFHFPQPDSEIWTPFVVPPFTPPAAADAGQPRMMFMMAFNALGRLAPGVSPEQAAAEASARVSAGGLRMLAIGGGEGNARPGTTCGSCRCWKRWSGRIGRRFWP